ncbi:heavy metal efflux pump, CzcA family [Chitinophaga costaii]|uniref:Heavy metal efflux pump, CzcA family n=1 Tax=Chitinophaga costaii TaxID=1335309 RepID=A0A1C4G5Z2_9BACT|nr:efflux RND transporter permease subunit [Chitinophaga costaii]PUZ20096.1 AcrB/AcrD/AcrF family protein [Chitinophaga costaii]SCC63618.1 heavy metal efflux pump, CzcA family [Chitinophaga costaii]
MNFFLRYKNPVTLILALIVAAGVFSYAKMQASLFPEISFPKIKIIADAGLQPVDKMMITVTKPLENALRQIPDLQNLRSTTSRGSCEISAFMDDHADMEASLQRINAKLAEVRDQLPPGVQLTAAKMNPSILPVIGYTLESHSLTPLALKMLANNTVRPYLSRVAGVSEVRVSGGANKEYWLELNLQKMSALGITPDVVNNALGQTNFMTANGFLSDYKQQYLTLTDASVQSIAALQQMVVKNDGKRVVLLQDIANVSVQEAISYTKINANGHDAVLVAIIKQPAANVVALSAAVKKQVASLQLLLPKDVTIKPYYQQADFVTDSIHSVLDCLWIGLALAMLVSIIFLRSFQASVTILLTVPVTLSFTLIILYSIGYTLNIMTLGAIAAAMGLIIDDAIVVVEQLHRTQEEQPDLPIGEVLQKSIRYLWPAMTGSSLSTLVIFVPFVFMTGVAGSYFKVMTNTMMISLVCSFFVTWLGLPVIYLLCSRNRSHRVHPSHSQRWVGFFMDRPWISMVFGMVLVAAVVIIIPRLETGFLPEMDEGSIVLDYATPPGTSVEETDRILRAVEQQIIQTPDIAAYSRRTGTQMGFFITEPNTGDYLIQLKKDRQRSTDKVIDELRQKIEDSQPALRVDFGQVIGDMLGDLMTSVQPIEIKVFGNSEQQLHTLASRIADVVEQTPGTADVFNGIVIAGPSVSIVPDAVRLAQYGLTPAVLQTQVQNALGGNVAGNILADEQQFPIRIMYKGDQRHSVAALQELPIFLPNGQLHPLNTLASVIVQPGDAEVERENGQSMGVITARLDGGSLGMVMQQLQQRIHKDIQLPPGYSITFGGAFAEQQKSFSELLLILLAAGLLVFGVLLFLFRQFKVAGLVIAIAVLGIAGSCVALFLTHTPLNVGSYTGLIMIVGIMGENAIFTYWQFQERLHQMGVRQAIIFSISTRLRPKLMTVAGAILALLPLSLGIGAGSQLHQPLAIAVTGGLLAALPLLLVVLPTCLWWMHKNNSEVLANP